MEMLDKEILLHPLQYMKKLINIIFLYIILMDDFYEKITGKHKTTPPQEEKKKKKPKITKQAQAAARAAEQVMPLPQPQAAARAAEQVMPLPLLCLFLVLLFKLEIETFTLSKIGKLDILFSFISNKKDSLLNRFLI